MIGRLNAAHVNQQGRTMLLSGPASVRRSLPGGHSARSDSMGSTRVARRAGSHAAASDSANTAAALMPYESGSRGVTPSSMDLVYRAATPSPASPRGTPTAARRIDSPKIRRSIWPGRAPSDMRSPNSRVRRLTAYSSTPNSPAAVSKTTLALNALLAVAKQRSTERALSRDFCNVVDSYTLAPG